MKSKKHFLRNFTFSAIFFLITRNYFKNYMLIFTNLFLPSVILIIFWSVFEKGSGDLFYVSKLLPGLAASGIFSVGLVSFSSIVAGWKKSVIFKKLKASPVPDWYLPFALLLFYLIISFISFWIVMIFATLISENVIKQLKSLSSMKRITNFLLGILFTILISCLMGLFIGFVATNETSAQAIGLVFMLLTAFLLGCYITPDILISNKNIGYASLSVPHYSSIKLIQLAWFEGGIFEGEDALLKTNEENSELYEMSYKNFQDIKASTKELVVGMKNIKKMVVEAESGDISKLKVKEIIDGINLSKSEAKWTKFSELDFKWQIQTLMAGWTSFLIFINLMVFKFKKNK